MLVNVLVSNHYPTVQHDDKVSYALQLMDDYDIFHIAVTKDEKFLGMVSKDDLLDADGNNKLEVLADHFHKRSVKASEHFLRALSIAAEANLSIVPVVSPELEWQGAIPCKALLEAATIFTGADEPGAIIVLEMERKSYSFGEISRLVESNDAHITQFNTYPEKDTGLLIVTIKINKFEVSGIIATFQRYDYQIRYFIGEEHYENELRHNYDHLMSYLKI